LLAEHHACQSQAEQARRRGAHLLRLRVGHGPLAGVVKRASPQRVRGAQRERVHPVRVAAQHADRAARLAVPHADLLVARACDEAVVAGPHDRVHRRGVAAHAEQLPPRRRVPDARGAVLGRGDELRRGHRDVRRPPRERRHPLRVPLTRASALRVVPFALRVPHVYHARLVAAHERGAVGRPRDRHDPRRVRAARALPQLRREVPELHRRVAGAGGEVAAIGAEVHREHRLLVACVSAPAFQHAQSVLLDTHT
jgi:hypothetical protein